MVFVPFSCALSIETIFGHFLALQINIPLANNPSKSVRVIKTEEKGSDVNIAAHLVNDGHKQLFDVAVLITNDSDLLEPLKIVRYELNCQWVFCIPRKRPVGY